MNRTQNTACLCLPLFFLISLAIPAATTVASQGEQETSGDQLPRRLGDKGQVPAELRREDGSVILPGQIPAQASIAARRSWKAIVDSMLSAEPMQSFRLNFALRQRVPEQNQSNDLNLTFSYLAPSFVRSKLESGRTLLRGPQGDYLIDGEEVIRLFGREAAEDKKQLDQMAEIASNFVGLTNPVSLRLVELSVLDKAPKELLAMHKLAAEKLEWLELTSPDFFLHGDGERTMGNDVALYHASLGVEAETKAVRMAVIQPVRESQAMQQAATFVNLEKHMPRAGLLVPHKIEVFSLDARDAAEGRRMKPTSLLMLDPRRGRLRARLSGRDFLPPER